MTDATSSLGRADEALERLRQLELELAEVRRLIRQRVARSTHAERFEVLPCRIGAELIAFDLESVREVVPLARLTHLPEAPPWVPGLLNLRGSSIPVLDVQSRLERAPRLPDLSELILILECHDRQIGTIVAGVEETRWIEPEEIDSDVANMTLGPYLSGSVPAAEHGHLLLFDLATLVELSDLPDAPDLPDPSEESRE